MAIENGYKDPFHQIPGKFILASQHLDHGHYSPSSSLYLIPYYYALLQVRIVVRHLPQTFQQVKKHAFGTQNPCECKASLVNILSSRSARELYNEMRLGHGGKEGRRVMGGVKQILDLGI